jgi:ketosteroid isomerase-like protein
MKLFLLAASFLILLPFQAFSQSSKEQLLQLDQGWEKALLESDVAFLENLLAEDFIWVHNHASMTDGKEQALARAKRIQSGQQANDTRNRTSRDQRVVILGQTGVVSGYTVVDRGPSPTTYHFMRSYALVNGEWKLVGNHTMVIPEGE